MRDVEERMRELLRERSHDVEFDPHIPTRVIRRSRVRRALTAASVGVTATASVFVVFAGVRAVSVPDRSTPADRSPSGTAEVGWRGIWEYTTREDAEGAQAQVDEGHSPWQTDAEAFLEAFALRADGLGWDRVYFDDSLDISDPDESGPLAIHLGDCPEVQDRTCRHEADVTIERLVRLDRTGIWSVTAIQGAGLGGGAAFPSTFVGFTVDDAVVVVSTRTGQIVSTIAGPDVVGPDAGGADFMTSEMALAPDRTGVYFAAMGDGGAVRRLMFVPLEGGSPQDMGPGWDPVPSPDGSRLAYVACTDERCGGALAIRDLATGEETTVSTVASGGVGLLTIEGWLADGRLAVNLYAPGETVSIRLIDPDRPPASLQEATEVVSPRPGATWWAVGGTHAATGGLLVEEACCGPDAERSRVISVDPGTGEELVSVADGAWWLAEPDPSGRHFLLVDDDGTVALARDGETPQRLAEGFSDVDW